MNWIEYEQFGEFENIENFRYQKIGEITNAFKIPEELLNESNGQNYAQAIFDAMQEDKL